MSQTPETVIKGSLPDLLGAICNQPPGREEISVLGPRIGGDAIPRFTVHWWVADEPFYKLVLDLANIEPNLLKHFSVDEAVRAIIASVRDNLNDFNLTPFLGSAQPHTTLLSCSSPAGVQAVSQGLLRLFSASRRALFLFPVRGLRPESDVVENEFVWLTPSAPRQIVESLLHLTDPQLTFDRFPPLLDPGARPLQNEDSMLGLIENGWEAGATALRRLAAALCLTLPDREAILMSDETPVIGTGAIFTDGGIEIQGRGPFLPPLVRARVFPRTFIDRMKDFLKARASKERDNRYRLALEFLALGWLFRESQAFMNWFIGIDALFGEPYRVNSSVGDGVKNRLQTVNRDLGDRIDLLLKIRHDLLHGRCSRISSSVHYIEYRRSFPNHLPLRDIFRILRECLTYEPSTTVS